MHSPMRLLPWGLALLALSVLWDLSGLDLWVQRHLGSGQGFPWRDSWLLSHLLHDDIKKVAAGFGLLSLGLLLTGRAPFRGLPKSQRYAMLCATLLLALAPSILKSLSHTSCPWYLQDFGGSVPYVSHWLLQRDGGPGHCFPAGHPFTVLAFWPLSMPALLTPRSRKWGWIACWLIGLSGLLLGAVQVLRGAHFVSHVL